MYSEDFHQTKDDSSIMFCSGLFFRDFNANSQNDPIISVSMISRCIKCGKKRLWNMKIMLNCQNCIEVLDPGFSWFRHQSFLLFASFG